MNTIMRILVASALVLSLGAISNISMAVEIKTGMAQPINNTVAHLEAALKAVNADDVETAQEHIKAARQSSKVIIGGTLEAKTQRGSDAIVNARLHLKEGHLDSAADSLKEAIETFKSMLRPSESGSRGGLK